MTVEELLCLFLRLVVGDYVAEEFLDCGREVILVFKPVKGVNVRSSLAVGVIPVSVEASVFVVFIWGRGLSVCGFHI